MKLKIKTNSKKKKTQFIFIVTVLIFLCSFLYVNHNKNVNPLQVEVDFSNRDVQFKLVNDHKLVFEEGNTFLKQLSELKEQTIKSYVKESKEKIVFIPTQVDTLKLTLEKGNYTIISKFKNDKIAKPYLNVLTEHVFEFIQETDIQEIYVFTMLPRKVGKAPLPPGSLTNVK